MSKKKSNNPLENQPYFIQYTYLDLEDGIAVDDFLTDVKQSELLKEFEPTLYIDSELQKEIKFVLDAWYIKKVTSSVVDINEGLEVDKWLQKNRPSLVFYSVHTGKEFFTDDEEYYQGYQNLDLKGFLIEEIIENMMNGKKIKKCVECGRFFIPNPSGKEQRFCSNACKQKAYRKRKNSS